MAPTNPMSMKPLPIGEAAGRLQNPTEGTLIRPRPDSGGDGRSFVETLNDSIKQVNKLQIQADKEIQDIITGESTDIAQTMISVQKASLSFQLMTQVRNKIVEAYEEVLRMPI
ncbi:MAG: flagellar hook-basal body complex protein FliE [Candidatus Poribacteria bacterium]|nr:flagellar hook-basal body complex protein FliE [Candidatus Poribacteria bacterium]